MSVLKGDKQKKMIMKNNRLLKRLKGTTACWLTAAMVLSCFGTVAGAATNDNSGTSSRSWNLNVSKSAGWTNEDKYIGKVKLSVPGDEAKKNIDVVFATDKSNSTESANFTGAAEQLFSDLNSRTNLNVKVGVVFGDSVAYDAVNETTNGGKAGLLDISAEDNKKVIESALATDFGKYMGTKGKSLGGSNSQDLVVKAEKLLNADQDDADKYIILLSDMYTYVYNGNLKTADGIVHSNMPCSKDLGYTNGFTHEESATGTYLQQYNDSLTSSQTGSSEGGAHLTNVEFGSWEELYNAYTNKELDAMGWNGDAIFRSSAYHLLGNGFNDADYQKIAAPYQPWSGFAGYNEHSVTGAEKSAILTYEECKKAMSSGCHISLVSTMEADNNTNYGGRRENYGNNAYRYLHGMIEALAAENPGSFTKYFTTNVSWQNEASDIFKNIGNEILYAIIKGTVTDQIGNKYTLCNSDGNEITTTDLSDSDFEMTLGGEKLNSEWNGTGLEFRDADGKAAYTAVYDPGEKTIRWDINTPVLKAKPVTLSYYVRVTAPQAAPGTYSNATNETARLDYWSSDDDTAKEASRFVDFEQPSLSYYVPGEGIMVNKAWKDNNNSAGKRPDSVTVELLKDGVVYDTVTLSEENSWHAAWEGLQIFATPADASASDATASLSDAEDGSLADGSVSFTVNSGTKTVWTVREVNVASGYTAAVTNAINENEKSDAFTLTNSYSPVSPSPSHHSGSSGGGSGSGTTAITQTSVPLTSGETATIDDTQEPLAVAPDADIIEAEDVPRARLPRTGETEKYSGLYVLLAALALLLGLAARKRPGER